MPHHDSGCILCGKPLEYFSMAKSVNCALCGAANLANAACEDGHFVCDACHARQGFEQISATVMASTSRNPLAIAVKAMHNKFVNMHGPEHHYLVPAVLLAAYRNSGQNLDLERALKTAQDRACGVPGGICGLWGSCGAAIGAGIFMSVATGATPMSDKEWKLANQLTAQCLHDIAQNGGVRCCKRDVFLSLLRAVSFLREELGVELEAPENLKCSFFAKNAACKKEACPFHPVKRNA